MVTECSRRAMVAVGIGPFESRRAAMFQRATNIPAPILADLLGVSEKNAADWAHLSGRDWNTYIGHRTHQEAT